MTERTALEIALDLDAASCSSFAKLEAAESLRQQHAEIERLKRERHHIYDLLARIHRDGGQYTAENGVEKACEDAESQVTAWLDTISGVDALIEQARIAEREACAVVCDDLCRMLPGTKSGSMLHFAAKRIRARLATYEAGMKHHEYRELVNTLTKIAREYGNTQQLRERIAHALPFDCDATDAPSVEDARAMGHTGSLADEAERFAFEAWMEGHEWGLGATWDGTGYVSTKDRTLGYPDWHAVSTRMLWAAWRDRAALSKQQSVKIPSNQAQDCS